MKKILCILHIVVVALFHAQSLTPTENYIYSRTYLEPVTSEQAGAQQIQNVQYFDGLGRSTQSILIKGSPSGKDIVVPVSYDNQGRQTKNYLPLPIDSQNGAYQPSAGENSVNSYYGIPNAYSEVAYEKSPLQRIDKQTAAGTEWQISGNHTQKVDYLSNVANEVKRYKVVTTWNPTTQLNDVAVSPASDDAYTSNGYYNANTLYKLVTKDEDDNETHSFTNAFNQTLLVRQINKKGNGTTENLDTYYVYDEFGNLVVTIPPKASGSALTPALLNSLCYQYRYDKYNRVVEKKLPEKGWEFFVYDKQNRQVLSQDANLRATNNNFGKTGWTFTKYDALGRMIYSGFFANTSSRIAMQTALNNMSSNALNNERVSTTPLTQNNINVYYTKEAFPTGSMTILNVNYYDEYPAGSPALPAQIQNQTTLGSNPVSMTSNGLSSVRSIKTFPTASYTKNVENDNWSSAFIWYDTLGRVIGTYSKNHLGGFTKTESLLDFSGKALESYTYHSRNTSNIDVTIKDRFVYNPQNFLVQHYQQINGNSEVLLTDYAYNDLGQVINKKVGNNLQSIDYTYNIRGWLTGINSNNLNNLGDKLFAYKIKYNTVEGVETPNNEYSDLKVKPKYNGNIAEVDWKTANDNIQRRYGYSYDGVNRLSAGFYQNDTNPYLKEYNEIMEYDKGGNITSLKRTSGAQAGTAMTIDNLAYIYNGNRLTNVSDTSQNYAGYPSASGNLIDYDDNGNMTSQKDKGINKITYNFLNLPSSIIYDTTYIIQDLFGNPAERNVNTQYIYSADGTKLKTEYTYFVSKSQTEIKKITEYLDGFQYENNALQFLANEEGYYDFVQNKYIYNYVDHLGNVRLSYTRLENGSAAILEENNYYPFGLRHAGYNSFLPSNSYKYKYNGKEVQESGMYDYGWRQYMSELGRWNGMDQLSESYHSTSPYAYVLNNPINRYDPDGMRVRPVSGGYEFTGSDIGELSSYLGSGGSYGSLINSLAAWQGGGMGGNFWSFMGSYSAWGGSGDAGGNIYTTTAGNGAAGNSQNLIQEIVWTRTKIGSVQSLDDWKTETAKAARQPGRAQMMGGFLDFMGFGDIIGAYIENNVSPEDQRTGALGLFAVAIALKKPGLIAKEIGAEGKIIGLGVDADLALHRGTGAITWKEAGWQKAKLTNVDWGKVFMDKYHFKSSFYDATKNATAIRFEVTNFSPLYHKPGMTNFEFNHILNNPGLLEKTTFIQNGNQVFWNGTQFISK